MEPWDCHHLESQSANIFVSGSIAEHRPCRALVSPPRTSPGPKISGLTKPWTFGNPCCKHSTGYRNFRTAVVAVSAAYQRAARCNRDKIDSEWQPPCTASIVDETRVIRDTGSAARVLVDFGVAREGDIVDWPIAPWQNVRIGGRIDTHLPNDSVLPRRVPNRFGMLATRSGRHQVVRQGRAAADLRSSVSVVARMLQLQLNE